MKRKTKKTKKQNKKVQKARKIVAKKKVRKSTKKAVRKQTKKTSVVANKVRKPRKIKPIQSDVVEQKPVQNEAPKKKRGRPRKVDTVKQAFSSNIFGLDSDIKASTMEPIVKGMFSIPRSEICGAKALRLFNVSLDEEGGRFIGYNYPKGNNEITVKEDMVSEEIWKALVQNSFPETYKNIQYIRLWDKGSR